MGGCSQLAKKKMKISPPMLVKTVHRRPEHSASSSSHDHHHRRKKKKKKKSSSSSSSSRLLSSSSSFFKGASLTPFKGAGTSLSPFKGACTSSSSFKKRATSFNLPRAVEEASPPAAPLVTVKPALTPRLEGTVSSTSSMSVSAINIAPLITSSVTARPVMLKTEAVAAPPIQATKGGSIGDSSGKQQQVVFLQKLFGDLATITGQSINTTVTGLLPGLVSSGVITVHPQGTSGTGPTTGTAASAKSVEYQQQEGSGNAAASQQSDPGTSTTNWMDWFIEQSGAEGIKENLEGSKLKSKQTLKKAGSNSKSQSTGSGASTSLGAGAANGSTGDASAAAGKSVVEGPPKKKKRKSTPCVRRKIDHIITPAEVTQEMLDLVAKRPKEKLHNQQCGTSCHQCRQKTSDTKTICRSGKCVGLRGFFCGPCLNTRYGEDACEALLDPDWHCPVCRGICNCSLCRKATGQGAVGQIAQRLPKMGFTSVSEYLNFKGETTHSGESAGVEGEGSDDSGGAMNPDDYLQIVEENEKQPQSIVGLQGHPNVEKIPADSSGEQYNDDITIEEVKIEGPYDDEDEDDEDSPAEDALSIE